MELIGPYLVACVLLAVAGVMKAVRPGDTARALAPLVRLPARVVALLVRVGAAVEAIVGLCGLVFPRDTTAAAVAASYGVFTLFVLYARWRGGALASCGCFGTPDTPATVLHAVIDACLAASATAVAVSAGGGTITEVLARQPLAGAPLVAVSAVGCWLAFLGLSAAGRLHAARLLVGSPARRRR